MTVVVEGKRGFYFGGHAQILTDDHEVAWAEKHVVTNPAHAWLLGKFVEADRANNNKQYFQLEGLRMAQPSIAHSPMNLDHSPRIVGAFVASDFVYPTTDDAAAFNPYIEALGVFWKAHFPKDWEKIQEAHADGHLFFSMECLPQQIACAGDAGCGQTFTYEGVQSPNYCDHINERSSVRDLIKPHFTAGAVLLPPVRPGWSDAEIHSLVARHAEVAERTYEQVATELPTLGPDGWEYIMGELMLLAEAGRVS